MKSRSLTLFALFVGISTMMVGSLAHAQTQDVKLDGPDLQVVLDKLFGTTTSDGLLQGTKSFELRAENIVLTPEQADMFFTPSPTNPEDISDLIAKAEAIKGAELKLSGSINGASFDFKLAGKEVKAEGLVMTQAEFDVLVAQLKASPGLHEAKIEATVDGQLKIAKLEIVAGKVKIETRNLNGKEPHPVPHVEPLAISERKGDGDADDKVHPQVQPVTINNPDLQVALDQLFGTTTSAGLLQGTKPFELRVENIVLTSQQADMFFASSATNPEDLSDLIAKAEAIKGSELKIAGTIDGKAFDLKMEGKEVKAEGLVLTQAEFDALVAQLKATTELHEAKIEATVDGQLKIAKLENIPGRVKIENRDLHGKDPHPAPHVEPLSNTGKSDARLAMTDRTDQSAKTVHPDVVEKIQRPEKVEKIERPQTIERVEKPAKIERIERPEVTQSGKGRG
jgi:hypothetical protein